MTRRNVFMVYTICVAAPRLEGGFISCNTNCGAYIPTTVKSSNGWKLVSYPGGIFFCISLADLQAYLLQFSTREKMIPISILIQDIRCDQGSPGDLRSPVFSFCGVLTHLSLRPSTAPRIDLPSISRFLAGARKNM